jgi:hypothetical protein
LPNHEEERVVLNKLDRRMESLASLFAVDVLSYAMMSFERCHAPSLRHAVPSLGLWREADYWVKAPTGHRLSAQGNALKRPSQNIIEF